MDAQITPSAVGGRLLDTLLRHALELLTRRGRVRRELQWIPADINGCAKIFVSSTQGGTIPLTQLPTGSTAHLTSLYADGFLTREALAVLQGFFNPAVEANRWLAAPAQQGPHGANAANRRRCLLRGKYHVEALDSNGTTLRDRALAEVAGALSAINRRRW